MSQIQKAATKIWNGLVEQGEFSFERGVSGANSCKYRGVSPVTQKQVRCAIGQLIDDRCYDPMLEGKRFGFHKLDNCLKKSGWDVDDTEMRIMLGDLQNMHDNASVATQSKYTSGPERKAVWNQFLKDVRERLIEKYGWVPPERKANVYISSGRKETVGNGENGTVVPGDIRRECRSDSLQPTTAS